jgi:hypothetical protein
VKETLAAGGQAVWAQVLSAVLGAWLMAAPAVLGYEGAPRLCDRVAGPVALGCALLALHEVARPVRRVNTAVGLLLLVAPGEFGHEGAALGNSLAVGALLIILSLFRGRLRYRYGGGWSAVWRPPAGPASG